MRILNKPILIAMVIGLVLGAAVPAQAQQVPFSVVVPVPPVLDFGISGMDRGSGFVGGCDVQLQCVGASVRVVQTQTTVDAGDISVALAGSVCLMDSTAPCGSPGDPGTGFVFTRRDLIAGSSHVDPPEFTLQFCVWKQAPRTVPTSCTDVPIEVSQLTPTSTGVTSLGDFVPQSILL